MEVKKILVTTQRGIPLGYQGENGVTEIVFPQTEELLAQNWTLLHQRAYDKEPYPVPLTVTAGGLVWTVTSGDTAVSGVGRAQLICSGPDGEILKTVTYNTNVAKSLHLCGEVPDPVKPWYDDIMQKLNQGGGGTVKTVNGVEPDESGNVTVEAEVPESLTKQVVANTEAIEQKLDAEKLPTAVDDALAQAKASGEFDGPQGPQGPKGDTGATGPTGATGAKGADGYTPERGVDYWTETDKAEIKEDLPLVKSVEQPVFVNSLDEMTDTSKVYVMPDGYLYANKTVKNSNLFRLSQVHYSSRLDNTSSEIVSSTTANAVLDWFPVTPGKYYAASIWRSDLSARNAYNPIITRAQLKLADGTVRIYTNSSGGNQFPTTDMGNGNAWGIPVENAVSMRIHFAIYISTSMDISTEALLSAYQPMITEGDTMGKAITNGLNATYMDGDAEEYAQWYNTGLAYNQPADYEDRIVDLEADVSTLQTDVTAIKSSLDSPASISPYYRNANYGTIPMEYYQGIGDSYDGEGFDRGNTIYETFIKAWKALLADHGSYVTETELGTASDGQAIYLYDFKPAQITNQLKPIPKVIIIAGQHGTEKADVYGLYYFVKNLLGKWTQHPALEYLRNHVRLMIVPVLNTYGFDHLTYKNGNGVNTNRNYDANWVLLDDTTSDQYGGAEPFDQPETQIVRDLIVANTDASLVIDLHACHNYNAETYENLIYMGVGTSEDSYYNRMIDVAANVLTSVSARYNVDYDIGQPDIVMGPLVTWAGAGILRSWVTANNTVGTLVEGLQGFYGGESFTGKVYKADEELIVNYLITALHHLAK